MSGTHVDNQIRIAQEIASDLSPIRTPKLPVPLKLEPIKKHIFIDVTNEIRPETPEYDDLPPSLQANSEWESVVSHLTTKLNQEFTQKMGYPLTDSQKQNLSVYLDQSE